MPSQAPLAQTPSASTRGAQRLHRQWWPGLFVIASLLSACPASSRETDTSAACDHSACKQRRTKATQSLASLQKRYTSLKARLQGLQTTQATLQKKLAWLQRSQQKAPKRRWSAHKLQRVPAQPIRNPRPTNRAFRRKRKRELQRYLYMRRQRIKHGHPASSCRDQEQRLTTQGMDAFAALTLKLCTQQYRLQGRYYWQTNDDKTIVIHSKRWRKRSIRRFLKQFADLIQEAHQLGFSTFLFVDTKGIKRQHRNLDFQNKWYGTRLQLPPTQ